GGGYVWPNITIISDGQRVIFDARETASRLEEPLRYIARVAAIVPVSEFEHAIDDFVEQVRGQLREESVKGTNLEAIWTELQDERKTPEIAKWRKFEALLGSDPGGVDDAIIERLILDSKELGEHGMEELAAETTDGRPATSEEVERLANAEGFDSNPYDAVRLGPRSHQSLPVREAAWKRGVAAAVALREQENLGAASISN